MATLNGANYKLAFVDKPSVKIEQGDVAGRLRTAYDEYDLDTLGVVIAAADVIELMRLPKGARVHEALIESPNMGATGIFDLGHGAVLDDAGATLDAADQNAFVDQADAGGQAVLKKMSDNPSLPGHLKKFAGEVPVRITCTEVTVAITGVIKVAVQYALD